MKQHITFRKFFQHLRPRQAAPKFDLLGHAELLRQIFQAFPLGTIANQPVFARRKSIVELREGSQAKLKPFKCKRLPTLNSRKVFSWRNGMALS